MSPSCSWHFFKKIKIKKSSLSFQNTQQRRKTRREETSVSVLPSEISWHWHLKGHCMLNKLLTAFFFFFFFGAQLHPCTSWVGFPKRHFSSPSPGSAGFRIALGQCSSQRSSQREPCFYRGGDYPFFNDIKVWKNSFGSTAI